MKVESINSNQLVRSYPARNASQPSFSGKAPGNLTDQIKDLLYNKKTLNVLSKFKDFNGEGGGILINSIGTGAIAPLFIAFNPLVKSPKNATKEQKQDLENTKKYTAMRQPVSAVLAILIQFGIQKPIDVFLDSLFNNPKIAKHLLLQLDHSTLNNDEYLSRQAAKEIKKEKLHFADKKSYKAALGRRVEIVNNRQISEIAKYLEQNGQIKIGERLIPDTDVANVINKQIDNYLEDARKFVIGEKGLSYYSERAEMLINNKDELTRILTNLPNGEKSLSDYLKKAINNSQSEDVKTLLKEILEYPTQQLRESRCKRTLKRIDKIINACNGNYNREAYLNSMLEDNSKLYKLIVNLQHGKIKDVKNANKDTIKAAIDKLVENCRFKKDSRLANILEKRIDTFMSDKGLLSEKVHKDIAKGYRELLKNRYKGFNQISKILIGAAIMVPITCTALNWVYPRFMDIFFPKLSGIKKGGDK